MPVGKTAVCSRVAGQGNAGCPSLQLGRLPFPAIRKLAQFVSSTQSLPFRTLSLPPGIRYSKGVHTVSRMSLRGSVLDCSLDCPPLKAACPGSPSCWSLTLARTTTVVLHPFPGYLAMHAGSLKAALPPCFSPASGSSRPGNGLPRPYNNLDPDSSILNP